MTQELEGPLDPSATGDARAGEVMAYDEQLVEKAHTQWQFGDWETLASLDPLSLRNHPARARLALLSAAACLQLGKLERARSLLRSSRDWGIGQREVLQLLLAGIHNSLGRAAAFGGDEKSAAAHFEAALETGVPGQDTRLLAGARTREQLNQVRCLMKPIESRAKKVLVPPKRSSNEPQPPLSASPKAIRPKTRPEKKKPTSAPPPPSGVQQMIDDLTPFFHGRQLTYVDVGAFVGDVFLSIAHSEIRVREAHLVEPNPESYEILVAKTTGLRRPRTLHLYQGALGRSPGNLHLRLGSSMSKVVDEKSNSLTSSQSISVPVCTLDSLIKKTTEHHVDLLKIDVEGFEEEVLKGACSSLSSQSIDVIIVEVGMNPGCHQQVYYRKIEDFLLVYGYRVFKIYDQVHEWICDSPLLRRANFVFMSERFSARNPYKLTSELYEIRKTLNRARESGRLREEPDD